MRLGYPTDHDIVCKSHGTTFERVRKLIQVAKLTNADFACEMCGDRVPVTGELHCKLMRCEPCQRKCQLGIDHVDGLHEDKPHPECTECKKKPAPMVTRVLPWTQVGAMVGALDNAGFKVERDSDTVVVKGARTGKEVFRGLRHSGSLWVVRFPRDLFTPAEVG